MENDTSQSDSTASGNNSTEQKQPAIPFPLNSGFSDDYLKATFWKCNYSSAGPEHAYWVILPNTIKPTSVDPKPLPQVGLNNIGIYNVIDKTLPYIEVWVAYETVKDKQTPTEWLLNKLRITGEKVLNQNEINYPNGQKNLDVLTVKTIGNGERVISRFTGVSKGNNYYVLKASANEKNYASQANTIFHIVSHWGLK
ncbi:hypothetical protein KHS38_20290 [Mucilaginibacter sp. Bleaf8]|uniref:hypothetical protein n=1 Tax=Mucilaginibacter sp. Bleaf8 TaxID=2834430 RepID=UPI001BCF820F|nr:hypothetical protein [Mucilaginibacter sp. Bleaf8]MBS7566756.1 hypothetical protein [Mucilaginibacter sp. Bleaf8]